MEVPLALVFTETDRLIHTFDGYTWNLPFPHPLMQGLRFLSTMACHINCNYLIYESFMSNDPRG